jgi:hypothetical protein
VGAEFSMFHYSAGMAKMIENELTNKGEEQLDFEKDPQHIVGELISALQGFDAVANRQCLNVIKPKLEIWLQTKLVTIREVVSRAIQFETWTPISEVNIAYN